MCVCVGGGSQTHPRGILPTLPSWYIKYRKNRGANVKASCMRGHGRCECWVSNSVVADKMQELLIDLLCWGADRDADEQTHFAASVRLRECWGVRVRRRR